MKINLRFPITEHVDVELDNGEKLRVLFKFPTESQSRQIAEDAKTVSGYAMSVCKFCVEEVTNLESEEGPVAIKAKASAGGSALSSEMVALLDNNGLSIPVALFYREHISPEREKKTSGSLLKESAPATGSPTNAVN